MLLAVSSTFFVNMYHMTITSKHRSSSGVKYPSAYASKELADKDPKAYKFNCGMSGLTFAAAKLFGSADSWGSTSLTLS